MPDYTRRQLRRDILREMILRECACQDAEMEDMRAAHGVKFHHNGPEAESGMIRSNLYTMSQQAQEMHDMVGMNDDLPEWVQEKIAVAGSMIDSVYDYLGYEYKAMRGDVSSHDSFNPDVAYEHDHHHDDHEDDEEFFMVDMMESVPYGDTLEEEEFEDLDADDVMHEPWQPHHQSTGIMFFEDELKESIRRRRQRRF